MKAAFFGLLQSLGYSDHLAKRLAVSHVYAHEQFLKACENFRKGEAVALLKKLYDDESEMFARDIIKERKQHLAMSEEDIIDDVRLYLDSVGAPASAKEILEECNITCSKKRLVMLLLRHVDSGLFYCQQGESGLEFGIRSDVGT